MKPFIKITTSLAILFLIGGCAKDTPVSPTDSLSGFSSGPQTGASKFNTFDVTSGSSTNNIIQTAEVVIRYKKNSNFYGNAILGHPNGSKLTILQNAFIPPADLWGQNVTISMTVEKDTLNNELIYTFGPHGSQFSIPASLWISWADLGSANANLYYIDDNGNYIPQPYDGINLNDKTFLLYVNHFSRYAVAYSN